MKARSWYLVASLVLALPAFAQQFPARPVRVVVAFPAGGPTDTIARAVAQRIGETQTLGQPMVVENRPGASTIVAAEAVAKSPADGHTILFTADATISVNPLLFNKLPYGAADFAPITLVAHVTEYILVNAGLPVTTMQELVAYSKANRGKLNYGSFGPGSSPHIETEAFKQATGADLTHVPFKGAAETIPALLAGQIHVMITSAFQPMPHLKSGKLRALAVLSKTRSPLFPNVPTTVESGLDGFDGKVWFGYLAPAKTPPDAIARLATEIGKVVNAPDFREKFITNVTLDPAPTGVEAFRQAIEADKEKYGRFVKAANVKLDY